MKILIFSMIAILMTSGITMGLPNAYADDFVIYTKCDSENLIITVYDKEGNYIERVKVQTIEYINSYGNYEKRFYTDQEGKTIINNYDNTGYVWVLKSGFNEQKIQVPSCSSEVKSTSDTAIWLNPNTQETKPIVKNEPKLPLTNIASKTDGYEFNLEYQCPPLQKYELVEHSSGSEKIYSYEPSFNAFVSVNIPHSPLQSIPSNLKIITHYTDGSIEGIYPNDFSFEIPQKNNDGKLTKFIIAADNYNPSEISINCNYDNYPQEELKNNFLRQEKFKIDSVEAENYCNYLIYGCKVTYDINYEINSQNDFVKRMWTEDNSFINTDKMRYSFNSITEQNFYYYLTAITKDNQKNTDSGRGFYEIGSPLILPYGRYYENGVNYNSERTSINVSGFDRDVWHFWSYLDLGITPYGDGEIREDLFYDISTGLLLKSQTVRSLLDVTGKENTDELTMEVSSINFPKNSNGGCLIATATYGSELAPQVQQLREIRDNSLLQTEFGTNFMSTFNDVYYSFSPIIADYERENPTFREMVKVAITPMITSLSILNYVDMDSESSVLGYGISLIMLNAMMYVGIPILAVMIFRK